MNKYLSILLALLPMCLPPRAAAQTYHIGTLIANSVNGVVNAAQQPGSDIGARVTSALASCSNQCTVYVPAGNYSYSTTILTPLVQPAQYALVLDPGAALTYTGSGDAIRAPVSTSVAISGIRIQGGRLIGTSAATAGIHILPTNSFFIQGMQITGFSSGDGIKDEGANAGLITESVISSNLNGVELVPTFCSGTTCGAGVSGTPYEPNNVTIFRNTILDNANWGIFGNTVAVGGGLTGSLGNHYIDNDLEQNGTAGSAFGAILEERSTGAVISNNYFESSPREIVLGFLSGGSGYTANGPVVRDNFFTTETGTPYNIELQNTANALVEGNSEQVAGSNASNCFLNAPTYNDSLGLSFGSNDITQANRMCLAGVPFQSAPAYVTPDMIAAAGGDIFTATNNLASQLPPNSTIYWTHLEPGNYQTGTGPLTALNNGSRMVLVKPAGVTVTVNTSFTTPTNSPSSCAIPIGAGSGIISEGGQASGPGDIFVGASARVWDVVCNGSFTGNQESLILDGITIAGNAAATVMGSLLHLQGVFVGTRVSNSGTYSCYANCLEVDPGTSFQVISDLLFDGDNFQDGATTGTYPGCVVSLNALNSVAGLANVVFMGGAIQFNGPHNPLLCINGQGSYQLQGITFYNVDHELNAASPSIYWANVDPIQITDAANIFWAYLRMFGTTNSTYQQNIVDISQTVSGSVYGILIQAMTAGSASGFTCLIKNNIDSTCETGYSNGGPGDLTLPPYQYGGTVAPWTRQTTYAPSGSCVSGSIWTDSAGTTLATTRFTCVSGSWVGG